MICLAEGIWQEYLTIERGLTLRGQGEERTIIDGSREGYPQKGFPIIWIRAPQEQTASVKIEGLTIQRAAGWSCADGRRKICPAGVRVEGQAQVEIAQVTLIHNGADPTGYGLQLRGSAKALVISATVFGNPNGIELWGSSQATITDSEVTGGRWGITLWDSARAEIANSALSSYRIGLWAREGSQATISHSTISQTGWAGISAADSAQAEVYDNIIERNYGCGISAGGEAEVRGRENRMAENGVDLCGDLSGDLRIPLAEPTELEIIYPDPRYETLQQAVDALLPGGRITLAEGEHLAGATIAKELSIEAVEEATEEVVLKGRSERNAPVLSLIRGGRLQLKGLTVTGGGEGLELAADSRARIEDSLITRNYWGGINVNDAAGVELIRSTVSWNGDGVGVWLEDAAWLRAIDSEIAEHGMLQILLEDASRLELIRSKISGKADGLLLRDAAQATITESEISGTRLSLRLEDVAWMRITGSLIAHNEQGILLRDLAEAWIEGNTILANEGYGVALYLKSCGFEGGQEAFWGRVIGRGNVIPGPEEPDGNREGAVCPEELEFLRTEEGGEQP